SSGNSEPVGTTSAANVLINRNRLHAMRLTPHGLGNRQLLQLGSNALSGQFATMDAVGHSTAAISVAGKRKAGQPSHQLFASNNPIQIRQFIRGHAPPVTTNSH